MKIKVKKIHEDAKIPEYATAGAAGFDFYALEDTVILAGQTKLIRTGLVFEIPDGYEMQIRPRSGLSLKTKLRLPNAPGTIDSDYRGEVGIIAWNASEQNEIQIKKGEKIAQGVVGPVMRVEFECTDSLSDTVRNIGGFGSTGA